MPKYIYRCESCPGHFEIYHGMTEDEDSCPQCESKDFHRVPQMPFVAIPKAPKGNAVGDEVKAAIEENKSILKDLKNKLKGEMDDF